MSRCESFGGFVRRHRKRLDWTQQNLSDFSGVTRGYIGAIEANVQGDKPKLETFAKLIIPMNVSAREILEFLQNYRRNI